MSNTKPRLLLVEDETSIAMMYEFKLKQFGYTVAVASNGLEGLALAENFVPDLILLDIKMPIMNGDEMLEKLRNTDWGGRIRVIILTNISRDEAPSKLQFLHVDRYVIKAHHTPSQIVKIVAEIV